MSMHTVFLYAGYLIVLVALNSAPALAQRTPQSEWKWVDTNIAEGCVHGTLHTESMDREVGYSVYLPPSYQSSGDRQYPVVYYLHGAGGSESSSREFAWAVKQAIEEGAINDVIYIFPNGGHYGGYRDWDDGAVLAETWIVKELMPHIEATYRTIESRKGRALCGWSMGGGGSLRFLMKYPERFCAAASISAAINMRGDHPEDSAEANLKRNIDQIRNNVGIWMAVGDEDRLKVDNEVFAEVLEEQCVQHSVTILPGVGHNLGQMSETFHRDIALFLNNGLSGGTISAQVGLAASGIRIISDVAYKPNATTEYEQERCKLDWYLPAEGTTGFPTLVWFHGGGLRNGHKADVNAVALAKRFAAEGIAVASVNYRLSPQVTYPAYIEDAAAAVAFVCNNVATRGGSNRVFVSGHSAGGYLTAMVGLHPAMLKPYGVTRNSLAGFLPISGQMITHSTVRGERSIPQPQPIIDEAAPAYYATANAAPFLCIVGSNDLPARSEENRYFVAAMQAAGHKAIRFLEFDGRDHGTIASRMGEPDDAVAKAIVEFVQSTAVHRE